MPLWLLSLPLNLIQPDWDVITHTCLARRSISGGWLSLSNLHFPKVSLPLRCFTFQATQADRISACTRIADTLDFVPALFLR